MRDDDKWYTIIIRRRKFSLNAWPANDFSLLNSSEKSKTICRRNLRERIYFVTNQAGAHYYRIIARFAHYNSCTFSLLVK